MSGRSDQEIVECARNGDMQAFRELVERHQAFVYRVAFRFIGTTADAEDITQDSFIRLWKNLNRYRPEIKLTTWLYKIVTNLCLDFLKSQYSRATKHTVDPHNFPNIATEMTADQPLMNEELRIALDNLTAQLSPKQKAVFVLREIEQVTTAEIADILAMDTGQVKSNLYYARKRVSAMITRYYEMKKERS